MKNTGTLQLLNAGFQLYFGVEKATCFKWMGKMEISFKEPCPSLDSIYCGRRLGGENPIEVEDDHAVIVDDAARAQ